MGSGIDEDKEHLGREGTLVPGNVLLEWPEFLFSSNRE
jgi:hypothetical protein